jgi:hypothetical protein
MEIEQHEKVIAMDSQNTTQKTGVWVTRKSNNQGFTKHYTENFGLSNTKK